MFVILYILFIVVVFGSIYIYPGYLYKLGNRQSYKLSEKYSTAWRIINYVALLLSFIALDLNVTYNMDFRGLWTTRIIIITLLFTGILYYPVFGNPKKIFPKIYFKCFSFLPLASVLFSFIPFLGMVVLASLVGRLIFPADKILYEDSKVRIETKFEGALGPLSMQGVKKKGIFEESLFNQPFGAFNKDSFSVKENNDSIYIRSTYRWMEHDTTYRYKY